MAPTSMVQEVGRFRGYGTSFITSYTVQVGYVKNNPYARNV